MPADTDASGETLVRDLGVPDKQISMNGVHYLAYVRQRTEIDPGSPVFIGGFGAWGPYGEPFGGYHGLYGGSLDPSITVWRCETTFELHDNKVVSFTLRRKDCNRTTST